MLNSSLILNHISSFYASLSSSPELGLIVTLEACQRPGQGKQQKLLGFKCLEVAYLIQAAH